MIQIIHQIPGRLRVRMPGLKENPVAAARIEKELLATVGVKSVTVNLRTGSVLVLYGYGVERVAQVLGVWALRTDRTEPESDGVLKFAKAHVIGMAIEKVVMALLAVFLGG